MKYLKLLCIIATCLLVTSIFTVIPAFSAQPPVDTSTYYVGTIGQPARLDPGRAYDTASGELIQNVYQPLIWFGSKNVVPVVSGGDYNLTASDHADLTYPSGYVPVVATALPIITYMNGPLGPNTAELWNFTINPNAQFQTWTGPSGAVDGMLKRNVTTDDVVYSFQEQMVMDSPYAPVWMLETAAFNFPTFAYVAPSAGNGANGPGGYSLSDEAVVAALIQSWCYKDPSHPTTNVIFNWSYPLPLSAMAQIMSQTWGSIVNKQFYVAHGMWDGYFLPGWSANYRWEPDGAGNRTPIDRYYGTLFNGSQASQYTASTPNVGTDIPDMCGTGPYKYEYGGWNQITETWRLDSDPTYWGFWANAGDKAGNYIHTIIEKGVDSWPTRKMLFLDGEFDGAVVPRANMFDLLTSFYVPLAGLQLDTNITELTNEVVFFNFNVSASSAYQSYEGYPGHIGSADPLFFNNINMRLAFAWALNYTQVISQAWFGEAYQQASWWVDGLVPAAAKNTTITMRNLDYNMMKYYLSQAIVNGQNISKVGFETTAVYNTGNDQRQIELQSIANAFAALGPQYKVNVLGLDWPVFLDNMNAGNMPIFCLGWLADYADPSDWASPYQQSSGSFLYTQITYPTAMPADQVAVDNEIVDAATQPNMTQRNLEYQDLQYKFWLDVPSIPVIQPVGRRFARDWVHGWYYNDLLPGLYWYDLYKQPGGAVTNVDLDVVHSIAPIATNSTIWIYYGQMVQSDMKPAMFTFNVTVIRHDGAGLMPTIISLERDNITALTDYRRRQSSAATGYDEFNTSYGINGANMNVPWPNGGWVYIEGIGAGTSGVSYILTAAQGDVLPADIIVPTTGSTSTSVILTWYEDGVSSTLPGNATWTMGARVGVASTAGTAWNITNPSTTQVTLGGYNFTSYTVTTEVSHGSTTYQKYAALLIGDINLDGTVNILDAIALSNNFGKGVPPAPAACDLNGDGQVNILDAILLANHFSQSIATNHWT